jgi:aminoglycoside phosphotransferase (APT) family kinase protein
MATTAKRDLEHARVALEHWAAEKLGVIEVAVSDLSVPKAGFSNETILGRLRWSDLDGGRHEARVVVRIEPSDHQLFLDPDAMFQARVMRALARHQVPVPEVLFEEPSAALLGAPFFVMRLVEGRIPSDLPSWHVAGWTTRLDRADRARLYDNALAALVALHATDWQDGLEFLQRRGSGSAFDRYLDHVDRWYRWSEPSRRFGVDVIDRALEHVWSRRPEHPDTGVTWGDARPGNIIFADDLSVAALLDWESATLGPAEIDVGWWLMFEEFLSEAQGVSRLDGIPDRAGTIARYEELGGRRLNDIRYYEILAGLVFSLINSRVADLTIANGLAVEVAAKYVTRVTDMMARWLDAAV